jgi:ubiquinone/menaquinone biosynthesis C-methylase UbiE
MLDVQRQFGRQAHRYARSYIHRRGRSLTAVLELAAARQGDLALDVGTGAGFTALGVAEHARRIIATDVTPEMLAQTQRLAGRRRLANVEVGLAAAEALPFADAAFDLVTCRLAAHHFRDVPAALAEFRRVARPGGRVVVCDTVSPEDEAVAAYMHDLELRRDPSHVRNLTVPTWRRLLAEAGLRLLEERLARSYQEFEEWVGRSNTAAAQVPGLRRDLERATAAARRIFGIRVRGGAIRWAWGNAIFLTVRES